MDKSKYRQMYELEDKHWWFLGKREFIKAVLSGKFTRGKILDLGSGTGGTTLFLKNYGEVTGVELSFCAEKYLKKRKINYVKSNIENLSFKTGSFDLVCLLDVLYHKNISNDTKVIKTAYRLLSKNGLILITDSALSFMLSHHDKKMHARERYYLSQMEKKLKIANFEIEKSSYTFFFTFPLFFLFRLLNKYLDFESLRKTNYLVNFILFHVCKLEAVFLKKLSFPIGSSIILLARKR